MAAISGCRKSPVFRHAAPWSTLHTMRHFWRISAILLGYVLILSAYATEMGRSSVLAMKLGAAGVIGGFMEFERRAHHKPIGIAGIVKSASVWPHRP
jgi:hypothetical protein